MNLKIMYKFLTVSLLSFILLFYSTSLQAQCAMCRSSLESNVSDGNVAVSAQLNFGILYLFVTPYLLFMLIVFFWYRASKRKWQKTLP